MRDRVKTMSVLIWLPETELRWFLFPQNRWHLYVYGSGEVFQNAKRKPLCKGQVHDMPFNVMNSDHSLDLISAICDKCQLVIMMGEMAE